MNTDLRPPLDKYKKAFKSRRQSKFTDTEWNRLAKDITQVKTYKAYPKNIRVYTNNVSQTAKDLKSVVPGIQSVENKSKYVWVHFQNKDRRAEALDLINSIVGDYIIAYDASNPLKATTANGRSVALTKAENYTNTIYKDSQGNDLVKADLVEKTEANAKAEAEAEEKAKRTRVIIILAVVLVVIGIAIFFVKFRKKK